MSTTEIANRYIAIHAFSLKTLTVEHPGGRTFRVQPGVVFLASPNVAHQAALAKLVRTVDLTTDRDAPVSSGNRELFCRHGGKFFEIAYHDAALAVKIEEYVQPAPRSNCVIQVVRPEPVPAPPLTGFEH
jgi:hypothetical protein